jgi:hypothetical protein
LVNDLGFGTKQIKKSLLQLIEGSAEELLDEKHECQLIQVKFVFDLK